MSTIYADPQILWARLLKRIERAESGCWLFTGCTNSRGYGLVCSGRKGKNVLTHRLAVIVRDGGIPEGMTVDHQCHESHKCRLDVACPHRRCVNPDHLKVMSSADNVRRRWEYEPPQPIRRPVPQSPEFAGRAFADILDDFLAGVHRFNATP